MIKYLLPILTIKKAIFILSSFLFTWLSSTFGIFNNLQKAFDLTIESLSERYIELMCMISFITLSVCIVNFLIKYYFKPIEKRKNTIKSVLTLSDVNEGSSELCKNNAVFLTRFKSDGNILYVSHLFYSLFSYYRDPINMFFLTVAFGQVYMFNDYRSLIPLTIFSIMAMIQYLNEVRMSIKQQIEINNCYSNKLDYDGISEKITRIKQRDLKRGDFIKLKYGESIPADILLLGNQLAVVNELDLTGESIDVQKSGLNINTSDIKELQKCKLTITHHENKGFLESSNNVIEYTQDNILFRGTKLIDGNIFGVIIETGNDCQIYRLDYEMTKNKTPIEIIMNNVCMQNLYLLIFLAIVCVTVVIHKSHQSLEFSSTTKNFSTFILLFNTMIPLSLQFFFNSSSKIISNRLAKKHNVKINSHGIRTFQFDPHFVVSDKTGTLTTNNIQLDQYYVQKKYSMEQMFQNVISCSSINLHSESKTLLKNDVLEEKLLERLTDGGSNLLVNQFSETSGYVEFEYNDTIHKLERIFCKSFIYCYGVKISIIKSNDHFVMHIQGMPEAILKYLVIDSSNRMNRLLHEIENNHNVNDPYYKRIIAHASKIITREECDRFVKSENKLEFLNNFDDWSVYVFHDFVVDGIRHIIHNFHKDLTMLTGDKFSSAVNVGKTTGLIKSDFTHIESDQIEQINDHKCIVISGNLIEKMIENKNENLKRIIESCDRRIIYRASPNVKQLFVSYLQHEFGKPVMMIGDGSNDISSIMKSDIGIGVMGENKTIQKVADVVVSNWTIIPELLKDFDKKKLIINNVCQWVIMKHMLSAFTLFGMLVTSFYEKIRDPANPFLMTFMNSMLFLYMIKYSYYEEITRVYNNISMTKWYIQGLLLGILNGIYVFSVIDYDNAIYLAISSIMLQLVLRLSSVDSNKGKINKLFYVITCSFVLGVLYFSSNLSIDTYFGYLLLSGILYKLIEFIY